MSSDKRRILLFAAAAVVLIAAVGGALAFLMRDDGSDANFFALATPRTCGLEISVADAHFAAHIGASVPLTPRAKFAIVTLAVRNNGSDRIILDALRFTMSEPNVSPKPPQAVSGAGSPLPGVIESGESVTGSLVFDVGAAAGAAKLVYDDGCAHQEWLVP